MENIILSLINSYFKIDDNFCLNICNEFGNQNQYIVLIEELSELQVELLSNNNINYICEEIAHVLISSKTTIFALNDQNKELDSEIIKNINNIDLILLIPYTQKQLTRNLRCKNNNFNEYLYCTIKNIISLIINDKDYNIYNMKNIIQNKINEKVFKYSNC